MCASTSTSTGTWVGNQSTAAIKIKTLLGQKYLAVDPLGTSSQDPSEAIPLSRTSSPYDVTTALEGLGSDLGQINSSSSARASARWPTRSAIRRRRCAPA